MTLSSFCCKRTPYGHIFCSTNTGQATQTTLYGHIFCSHRRVCLLQFLLTLLSYQGYREFRPPFLPLFNPSLLLKTSSAQFTHKNAALVMPKFGLTVEKRPGAAIEGGSTRIHLLADSELTQVKQSTTSTAREFRGLEQSIRERPELCKRPDYHYDQRTDQNVPESILGFFNVSNHGGYNQGDTNCVRQIYERILDGMKGRTKQSKGKQQPYGPHHDRQGRESQNNADYFAHFPIVRAHLSSLNEQTTLIARAIRGKRGKPASRVNQSDKQIVTLLTNSVCRNMTRLFVRLHGQVGPFNRRFN